MTSVFQSAKTGLLVLGLLVISSLIQADPDAVSLAQVQEQLKEAKLMTDTLWVTIAAAFVFLMQAGFLMLEVGFVQKKNSASMAVKNLIDWVVLSLAFFMFGFGLMFGHSNGIIGFDLFFLNNLGQEGGSPLGVTFFVFQLAFAGTSLTIVSGAMSERTAFIPYICAAVLMAMFIYPVFGNWAWGDLYFEGNKPWLAELGFIDFAGSTVVHSVGAWVALVGAVLVGPRLGRYDKDGNIRKIEANSIARAGYGALILWFGWWGFNGGSTLAMNADVGKIILNTNLSASAAGIVAFFHCFWLQDRSDLYRKLIGGILAGLVAVTASCHMVSHVGAIMVGATAGVIHNYGYDLILKKFRIDDPVGAIPVHGVCGIWGTLCVAIFGQSEYFEVGSRLEQLGVQLIGIGAAAAWAVPVAFIVFKLLKMTVGLRVSPDVESKGICISAEFESKNETLNSDLEAMLRAKLKMQADRK